MCWSFGVSNLNGDYFGRNEFQCNLAEISDGYAKISAVKYKTVYMARSQCTYVKKMFFFWCQSQLQNSQNSPMFGSLWLEFQCFDITAVSPYDLLKQA